MSRRAFSAHLGRLHAADELHGTGQGSVAILDAPGIGSGGGIGQFCVNYGAERLRLHMLQAIEAKFGRGMKSFRFVWHEMAVTSSDLLQRMDNGDFDQGGNRATADGLFAILARESTLALPSLAPSAQPPPGADTDARLCAQLRDAAGPHAVGNHVRRHSHVAAEGSSSGGASPSHLRSSQVDRTFSVRHYASEVQYDVAGWSAQATSECI